MKIQRQQLEARNCLNFSQVKQDPSLQEERFKPFVDSFDNQPVQSALANAEKLHRSADYRAGETKVSRTLWSGAAAAGAGAGVWAAVAGNPWLAGGLALAATAAGGMGVWNHLDHKVSKAEAQLAEAALGTMTKAADDYAATLVCNGPGPDQFTDRRYYTGGVINSIATVHSRESGAVLRTQVELGGAVPRKLEANLAKSTVSIRSPQGDQTFDGHIKLEDQGFCVSSNAPTNGGSNGPVSQTIYPDGSTQLYGEDGNHGLYFESAKSQPTEGFVASTYVWENGQVAQTRKNGLYVANPIVPFQDLSNVRVLPDGVVGFKTGSKTTHEAREAILPPSHGIGTWTGVSGPQYTARLLETQFAGGFTALGDQKDGTVQITAGDKSTMETAATLVENNGAYRLQNRHTLGTLEQSLLPGEVLLNLQDGDRTISVQHKSGSQPMASQHKDEDFLTSGDSLAVSLDDTGIYWVGEGASKIDIKPLMPLTFLEKKAP